MQKSSEENRIIQRDSNIELFRIILMLVIIAHHYVVNSGLSSIEGPIAENMGSLRSLGLLIFGAWGKTGINCFVLITGYFSCKMDVTARKFFKLLFEVLFYKIIIGLIFIVSGYTQPSPAVILDMIFPFTEVGRNFTATYLLFFLCIPFLNILIRSMTEKQHFSLLVTLGFIYVFLGTIPYIVISTNYVTWFSVVYLLAAFIRLYPKKIYGNRRFWGIMLLVSMGIGIASVIVCTLLGLIAGPGYWYIFVTDCNTFLAVLTSVCAFLYFMNINIGHSRFINTVSATTFGVFLIHTSGSMARWLWIDTLKNVEMYSSALMPLHAILSVVCVFVVCSVIDLARINLVEKPFFRVWDRHWPKIQSKFQQRWDSFCSRLGIGN